MVEPSTPVPGGRGGRARVVRVAHQAVRHARVQLALKGAFAAAMAWFVAARLLPDDVATYAYYAPLGAVIAIHPTVHRSATEAGRNVAGIVIGAVIALVTEALLGVSVLTVALVVAVGILVGGMRWLGSQSGWVPTAALLTLVVGSHDQQDYVLAYAGLTLMGAVLAVMVNLLLPSLPMVRSARSLTDLRDTLAGELDALADHYCPPADSAARAERSSRRHLDHLLGEMQSAVRESGEAADANRRARTQRETLRGLHRQAQALEQLGFLVQDLGLLLDDHDSGGRSLGSAPQVRAPRPRRCAPWPTPFGRCRRQVRPGPHRRGRRRRRPPRHHAPGTPARRRLPAGPLGHRHRGDRPSPVDHRHPPQRRGRSATRLTHSP
ncbi:FUSC family protein [Pengzhenrongella frigida]|uniref:FUSC family protein n=1 Tax=Pengzhenrongella frigida TaxID=1259133 RepID=A0A4Q5MUZ9_9MICO|nr:aromatic acid exporter family protein [Cellulomonas sp. HLT2-17]RYV49368.1 hypothetical protein EUA98_19160 [Cellulomonas sp. HLT2-17]